MEHRIYVETHIDPSRLRYVVQFLENFLLKEAATIPRKVIKLKHS